MSTQPLHLPGQLHVLKRQSSRLPGVQWLYVLRHLRFNTSTCANGTKTIESRQVYRCLDLIIS